jgi:ArsR family transcriptional regulator, arsenate/arsenite/antimonite-responsive transcriptional repressor
MREFITCIRALADQNRIRALLSLQGRELCLCQIIELLELAPSTISKHMSVLKQAGLVECRKQSRWVYYQLPQAGVAPEIQGLIDWTCRSLANTPQAKQDIRRLEEILKMNPEELCKKQTKG